MFFTIYRNFLGGRASPFFMDGFLHAQSQNAACTTKKYKTVNKTFYFFLFTADRTVLATANTTSGSTRNYLEAIIICSSSGVPFFWWPSYKNKTSTTRSFFGGPLVVVGVRNISIVVAALVRIKGGLPNSPFGSLSNVKADQKIDKS